MAPRLGLRANLGQFSLLVLVNAFVGAMVGMERSIRMRETLAEPTVEAPPAGAVHKPLTPAGATP